MLLLKKDREPGVRLAFKALARGTAGWKDGTDIGWRYTVLCHEPDWEEITEAEAAKLAAFLGGSLADDSGSLVDRSLYKSEAEQEQSYQKLLQRWANVTVPPGAETVV